MLLQRQLHEDSPPWPSRLGHVNKDIPIQPQTALGALLEDPRLRLWHK